MFLSLKEICVSRHGLAPPELERFSLTIERGETVILLGEGDPGRDALLRVLAGAIDPGETLGGTVKLGIGTEVGAEGIASLPIRIAYVAGPAAGPLNPRVGAASQLARVIARKTSLPRASAEVELGVVLSRLSGAPDLETLTKPAAELSAEALAWGALAAGCACVPELMLVDRLVADLPPLVARQIARGLAAEQQRQGFAILYNALSTEVVHWLGGRLIVMRHGRIVEEGPASRLATAQAHAYTRTLLKKNNAPQDGPPPRPHARGQPVVQALALETAGREKITFELRRGGSLAFVGEDGSGRRRLARQLIGMEKARSGRIVFDAVDIGVLSEEMMARMRRRVAVIAGADDILDPRLSVSDTVSEPLRASLRLPVRIVQGYRDAALKRVGLLSLDHGMAVGELSDFDKRRLQVARAIVCAPVFALIDEPLRGLDAFAQSVMRDLLQGLRAEEGPAFLVITSDMAVAQALAEEAMVFRDGRIVERGAIAEMVRAPKEAYTRMLVEAASVLL